MDEKLPELEPQVSHSFVIKVVSRKKAFNSIPPGLFEGGAAWGVGGGGGWKVPAVYSSKTINDDEMKLGGVV